VLHRRNLTILCMIVLFVPWSVGPTAAQEGVSAGASITVVDALGREVTLEKLPARIVAPGKATWMLAHALYLFPEANSRVLAMEEHRGVASEFIASLYPNFADKPHVEMNASAEQIAPLKPDLVILKSYMKDRLGDSLEQLGLPVVYVDLETPEQFFRDVANLGILFGDEQRANEIKAFYQERLDLLRQRLGGVDPTARPEVLVIQSTDRAQEIAFEVPPVQWMQTIEITLAGGNPVWDETANQTGWNIVNFEQIAAWDPDEIFVIVFRDDPAPVLDRLNSDSKWQALRAVKNGDLRAFPADYFGWDVPDPRWILGVMWAAKTMHPDLFADIDLTEEIHSFYGQMYGMDRSTISEEIISRLTGDVIAKPDAKATAPLTRE